MRIILVGATGTIGKAVAAALVDDDIVAVSHRSTQHTVDLGSRDSIGRLLDGMGPFDALVCAAGQAKFGPVDGLSDADFELSLGNKLMGQVNLVRLGLDRIADGGSFTLTSGVLSREPMRGSAAVSLVNAGVEAFACAAALEAPRGIRINVVSPPWVKETMEAMGMDPEPGVPAASVARAYVESVRSERNGEVIDARAFA